MRRSLWELLGLGWLRDGWIKRHDQERQLFGMSNSIDGTHMDAEQCFDELYACIVHTYSGGELPFMWRQVTSVGVAFVPLITKTEGEMRYLLDERRIVSEMAKLAGEDVSVVRFTRDKVVDIVRKT